ncbi:alpha/beta hydrolase [Ruania zhangjianzhongii]|uniref:alpha/beta hydrolase n=1 Tax=Ruania zhangjianzhongii TaxID=2603206 RepID=UPI0011CBE32F|nr:alpha/beta hydrolase [Ruania zhangjianzhongii]
MTEDVLGPGWVARTLPLAPDGVGRTHARTTAGAPGPVATLVHRTETGTRRRAVLYLHGFTDYFFQADHAQAWTAHGYDFYAVDLRDYGRSIRPGRTPGWITDLTTYDEDVTAALTAVREHGYDQVVLLGHSTGGLIAALYTDRFPDAVDALVLNSPWLDLNSSWLDRVVLTRVLDAVAMWVPRLKVSTLGEAYGRHLHVSTGGDWDYDLAWKPMVDVPVYAAWLRAIRRGHARVGRGLDLRVPVLVCTSGRSGHRSRPSAVDLAGADCVLNVAHMHARGPRLGPDVRMATIDGGRHDLALSAPPARRAYEEAVFSWLSRRLPAR